MRQGQASLPRPTRGEALSPTAGCAEPALLEGAEADCVCDCPSLQGEKLRLHFRGLKVKSLRGRPALGCHPPSEGAPTLCPEAL